MRVFYSLVIAAVFLLGVGVSQAQEAKSPDLGLSVFKLGEVNANDKQAGEAIDKLAKHLSDQVKDAKFARRGVRNKPDDTLTLLKDDKNPTALAIVSPGFYFKHKDSLKLTALAEARRGGFNGEQYTLVGNVKAEKYPEGKKVATTLDADLDWLDKVVLPRPQGAKPVQWVHYDNLADAGYLFVDEPKSAPDFILLVDAADMGEEPGTVRWLEWESVANVGGSTHSLPLTVVVRYLIEELGCEIGLLGIQPLKLPLLGRPLSDEVQAAVGTVVRAIGERMA